MRAPMFACAADVAGKMAFEEVKAPTGGGYRCRRACVQPQWQRENHSGNRSEMPGLPAADEGGEKSRLMHEGPSGAAVATGNVKR